ncbi:MAG: YkgJ family cysteine cluster protein [Bacteroidetes bacterium]|nr:YkgJ family cysteine cluster protein [Bacteroidota bacterium]
MDLKKFNRKAASKKKELTKFLKKLDKIVPEDMPKLVAEVDKTVWEEVDCMNCANCCKTMTPTYTRKDIVRISEHLKMTPKEFTDKWLEKDPDNGDWMNKKQPCQFLIDNKCSIYEVRPKDCAEFPHHNKKPFDMYNDTFIQNVHRCPATFMLVNRLRKRVEKEYEW